MRYYAPGNNSGTSATNFMGSSHFHPGWRAVLTSFHASADTPMPASPGTLLLQILVVDGHPLIARGIASLLSDRPEVVVHSASTAESGVALFTEKHPQLTLIEANLPDGSGLQLISRLREVRSAARFIVLTHDDDPVVAAEALDSGAIGFVTKFEPLDMLVEAIDTVLDQRPWLPRRMVQDVARMRSTERLYRMDISDRELSVLRGLAHGETMSELAFRLGVSYKTISNDCAALREQFGAKSLAELVRIALSRKIIN